MKQIKPHGHNQAMAFTHIKLSHLLCFALVLCVGLSFARYSSSSIRASSSYSPLKRATLSQNISVQSAGAANPYINLSDGRDLITPYAGDDRLVHALERNEAEPVSLASADFDEDGVPDLISGYAEAGGGIVTLLRGNVDSIFPNSPEAKHRKDEETFTDAPFLSPAFTYLAPEAAGFIAVGDFDGDSHWDVATAAREGNKLYLLSGNGRGGLSLTKQIDLPGRITALTCGDINRRDGLHDLVVGVASKGEIKVFVYEGPQGALRAKPEVFTAPEEVTSIAVGQLDDGYEMDIAVAAGHELMLVHGRDRKLSHSADRQAEVKPVRIERQDFALRIQSIAVGNFIVPHTNGIAILSEGGTLSVLNRPESKQQIKAAEQGEGASIQSWRNSVIASSRWSEEAHLVRARVSSMPLDNLMIIDSASRSLRIIATDEQALEMNETTPRANSRSNVVSLSLQTENELTAVLPMRLNPDALTDLVILARGQSSPAVITTTALEIFDVTNINDDGVGSLRQAIRDANSNPGTDSIRFNISSGSKTINLVSSLPEVTDSVVIDGTTQQGYIDTPIIKLREDNGFSMLKVTAGNTVVRGINFCTTSTNYCIEVEGAGNNRFESNVITNATTVGFAGTGIAIRSSDNTIGGTSRNAGNAFERRFEGSAIFISGAIASNNHILGNGFGNISNDCQPGGATASFPGSGVGITGASNTVVGGVEPGTRNTFSTDIINISASRTAGTLVQGNYIGTDASGTQKSGSAEGIRLTNTLGTTVGGTVSFARNLISGSQYQGVGVQGPKDGFGDNQIQGNYIGTDVSGTKAVGNFTGVLINEARGTLVGGDIPEARNIISGNTYGIVFGQVLPTYIFVGDFTTGGTDFLVQGNYIGTDFTGNSPLGNQGDGISVFANSFIHTIKNNRIAYNKSNGIKITERLRDSTDVAGFKINIESNLIYSNGALGIELGDDGTNTPNDLRDEDNGANERQNFPEFTSLTDGGKTIRGTLQSTPNTEFTIQVFYTPAANNLDFNSEGLPIPPQLIATLKALTNVNGLAEFVSNAQNSITGGSVNGTATDPNGNTSEISPSKPTSGKPAPIIDNVSVKKKKLFVIGKNFDQGAVILINGQDQKTSNSDPATQKLLAKKSGKVIKAQDSIIVKNADGTPSNVYPYR
jgi:hypothetical protein